MSAWVPIDLDAGRQGSMWEILRVAAADRPITVVDGDYAYDNLDGDEYDGSRCTDEVYELIRAGLLTDRGGVIRITDTGRDDLAVTS